MNRRKIDWLFLLGVIVFSCIFISSTTMGYKLREHEQLANEVTAKAALKISKKFDINPIGSGGSMMEEVKMLSLSFNCLRELSMEDMRAMGIQCINDYVSIVNEYEVIHPFLSNFPFTSENVKVDIFFYKEGFQELEPGKICCITIGSGIVSYYANDKEDNLKKIHKETYEEALKIVKEQGKLEQ